VCEQQAQLWYNFFSLQSFQNPRISAFITT
jgi:hypothetical protein